MTFLKSHLSIIVIATAFLLINLININDYGVSWDEPLHNTWALQIKEHLAEGKPGLPDLVGKGIYYGPLYFLANNTILNIGTDIFDMQPSAAFHIINIFAATIGILFLYALALTIFNKRIALFACMFFVLFPRFIAHAHYNPKDIPVMTAMIAVLLCLYLLKEKRTAKLAILTGVALGISIAIKITALLVIPIFFIPYLIERTLIQRRKWKEWMMDDTKIIMICLITTFITIFIAWPTMWRDPFLLFKGIYFFFLSGDFWSGNVLYFGKLYNAQELPWHYVPIYFFLVTPIVTSFCLLIGFISSGKKIIQREKFFAYSLILSWFLFPILLGMKPGLARYDGIRQFFLIVPALAILAALGLNEILTLLAQKMPQHKKYHTPAAVSVICMIVLIQIIKIHPYQGSYFNELVPLFIPEHIEDHFEIEYWGSTYKEGMTWLRENAEPNPVICIPLTGQLVLFYTDTWRSDFGFNCDETANYLMYFTRYSLLENRYREWPKELVHTIQRYDSDLLQIYKTR